MSKNINITHRKSDNICPYCREGLSSEGLVCKECQAVMHQECAKSHNNKCVSCNNRIATNMVVRSNKWMNSPLGNPSADAARWEKRGRDIVRGRSPRYHRQIRTPLRIPKRSWWENYRNKERLQIAAVILSIAFLFFTLWAWADNSYKKSIRSVDAYVIDKEITKRYDDGQTYYSYYISTQDYNAKGEVEEYETSKREYEIIKSGKRYIFVVGGIFQTKIISSSKMPEPRPKSKASEQNDDYKEEDQDGY